MRTHKMEITPVKTYASETNAIKAVEKAIPNSNSKDALRYFIMATPEGRYFPVFVGEIAIQHGVHFKFNVIG